MSFLTVFVKPSVSNTQELKKRLLSVKNPLLSANSPLLTDKTLLFELLILFWTWPKFSSALPPDSPFLEYTKMSYLRLQGVLLFIILNAAVRCSTLVRQIPRSPK